MGCLEAIKHIPVIRRIGRAIPRVSRLRLAWAFLRREGLSLSSAWRLSAVSKYTLLEPARLGALHHLSRDLVEARISGSFVECGSSAGGSGALLGAVASDDASRSVWMFDSWEGVPTPTEHDVMYDGQSGQAGWWAAPRERAEEITFEVMKLGPDRVRLVQGWFDETLPEAKEALGDIALLHVDADWYESVKTCFDVLYDRVVDGGVVVIDDYGCWQGCRRAVDEFIAGRKERIALVPVDWTAVYFRKPSAVPS